MNRTEKINILLVDDIEANLLVLESLLESPELNIVKANSGSEALELMLEYDFAIVLLDVQMPEMDGFETAELMKGSKKTRHIPIIFVTAIHKQKSHMFKGYEAGAVDYMLKPVEPEILNSKVNVFLELYRQKKLIEEANETLEIRVRERTAALEQRTVEIEELNKSLAQQVRELEALTKKLEKAKKDAEAASIAKSRFLSNMGIELKTPLVHIIGFVELALDERPGNLSEEQEEYLNDTLESSRQLLAIIDSILDFSNAEEGKLKLEPSDVDIKMLFENCLAMIKEVAENHEIRVSTEIKEIPDSITADEPKLKQIMYNLISNALQFTPDGGKIHLTASRIKASRLHFLKHLNGSRQRSTEDVIKITVKDTGIGLKQEALERIFRPFEQIDSSASRSYQGTGLGLSLTRVLVELHNGRIWVESEGEGRGSSFHFMIPFLR